jgi:hypothetical protein
MPELLHQRCLNHLQREAVARCTACRQYFCRECISEHQARVLCAACLRKAADARPGRRGRFGGLMRLGQCLAGLVLAWLFFYIMGECLLTLPSSFHEGTVWRIHWLESK